MSQHPESNPSLSANPMAPKMAPPRRRSSVGRMSVDSIPGNGTGESELQSYEYMGIREHRPDYGA